MVPVISVIIPARNARNTIQKCLDSILSLNHPSYETIIINDGSKDDTAEILSKYKDITILETNGIGPSKARNEGIRHSKGEYIAFTDSDCVVDKEWLKELMKGFIDEKTACVGGAQLSPADESLFGKRVYEFFETAGFITDYIKSGGKMREVSHNPSCNSMYRKDILVNVGGFLEGLWPGEDVELDYRIKKKGYKVIFNPNARVYHYRQENIEKFYNMMLRYGMAQGILVRKYGFFRAIQLIPLFFLILMAIFLYSRFIFLLVSTMFLAGLIVRILFNSKNIILMLWFYLVTSFGWNIGFLKGLFKNYEDITSL